MGIAQHCWASPRNGLSKFTRVVSTNSPYSLLADRVSDVFRFACLGRHSDCALPQSAWSSNRRPPRRSSGPDLRFRIQQGDRADPLLPANQDRLTDNVQLTRGDIKGLLNAALDCDAFGCTYSDNSPKGTEWATELQNSGATIAATNWAALNFVDWEVAYGDRGLLINNITSFPAVVHLIADDVYLDLKFSQWGAHSGGGFTYERSTPVPEPATLWMLLAGILTMCSLRSTKVSSTHIP